MIQWAATQSLCCFTQIKEGGKCYYSPKKPPSGGHLLRVVKVNEQGHPVIRRKDAPQILGVDPLDSIGM